MSETKTNDIQKLKKRYSYYKRILDTKQSLTESQQKAFDEITQLLGDNLPKKRTSRMTDEERKTKRKEYYQKNKETIIEHNTQWNKSNKDKVAEYNKKSYNKRTKKVDEVNE